MAAHCVLKTFSHVSKRFIPHMVLKFSSPSRNFCTPFASSSYSTFTLNELDNELEQKQAYEKLAKEVGLIRSGTLSGVKENILVVYPKIRWGKNSIPKNTTHELQLEEAVALVKTLPGFNVVNTVMVGTDKSVRKKFIWNQGRLESLLELKSSMNVTAIFINVDMLSPDQQVKIWATLMNVTAIFINVDMLSPDQQSTLYGFFKVPIYDRYNVVLSIFKHYARTKEAQLQIALAEIPYMRNRLKFLQTHKKTTAEMLHLENVEQLSGSKADQFEILRSREQTLEKQIKRAIRSKEKNLEEIRKSDRGLTKTCIVAVVGYTNAGKTTFIQRNRIFLADTIGFISNLPIQLFASFSATLSHVVNADIIIHVIDVSHPDCVQQRIEVLETLKNLKIDSTTHRIIEVGNKVDRIENLEQVHHTFQFSKKVEFPPPDLMLISCQTGLGFTDLIQSLDKHVMDITQSRMRRIKLKLNSPGIEYLYANKLVGKKPVASECENFLVFDVVMNDNQFEKFQAFLGKELKLKKSTD
uniref:Hflx-type G domain-containing protein n=1 Tax=Acrobeloides nanus TaxID=290746 RepID=A0A914DBS3_9BILA